jgi:hypothetical protein
MSWFGKKPTTRQLPATGAIVRINRGLFGVGSPQLPYPQGNGTFYHFHEGDLFTPGSQNFVFESPLELPLQSIWGGGGAAQGFLIEGSGNGFFNPYQSPQIYSEQRVFTNGLGGLQAGELEFYPLILNEAAGT